MEISEAQREIIARNLSTPRCKGESMVNFLARILFDTDIATQDMVWRLPRRIARLINRPTCRNVYDPNEMSGCENGFKCSRCGGAVEDCEGYRVRGEFNFCPKCGAKVVGRRSDDGAAELVVPTSLNRLPTWRNDAIERNDCHMEK